MIQEDKLQKANELEKQAKQLRIEAYEAKRKQEVQKEEEFRKIHKIDVYTSDDYCGLTARGYSFYYGYEETVCPKHKQEDCEDRFDCELREWAFTAGVNGKEVLRLPTSKLYPEAGKSPFWYLIAGIGHFLLLNQTK